jgi:lipid-binding SYLF domain-containing protein
MKAMWLAVVAILGVGGMAQAQMAKDDAERVQKAAEVVRALRGAPDNGIPDELFGKANCVVVMTGVKKAALGIGGEYGKGVMSCRTADAWSAPVFMQLAKGSVGFQIGAQEADLVLLVMNKNGIEKMLNDKVTLGADASVAAGPVGRTGAAATDVRLNAQVLSYSRSRGLFAGIDLSGGVLRPDKDANEKAYGKTVAPITVVQGNAGPAPATARVLVDALGNTGVRATTGVR